MFIDNNNTNSDTNNTNTDIDYTDIRTISNELLYLFFSIYIISGIILIIMCSVRK